MNYILNNPTLIFSFSALRHYSSTLEKNSTNVVGNLQDSTVGNATDKETEAEVSAGIERYENFLTSAEEESLMKEIEPQFKRLRYEDSHWDDVGINFFPLVIFLEKLFF